MLPQFSFCGSSVEWKIWMCFTGVLLGVIFHLRMGSTVRSTALLKLSRVSMQRTLTCTIGSGSTTTGFLVTPSKPLRLLPRSVGVCLFYKDYFIEELSMFQMYRTS